MCRSANVDGSREAMIVRLSTATCDAQEMDEGMTAGNQLHWWSSPRALFRAILMLDDTPHSIALGAAIGMFIGLTPTVGIQMLLVMLFAWLTSRLFYFNRVAGLLTVYISNPITMLPMYWFNYEVGTWLMVSDSISRDDFQGMLEYQGLREWWDTVWALILEVGLPLTVGSLLVATIGGLLTYPAIRLLVQSVQKTDSPISSPGASESLAKNETAPGTDSPSKHERASA